MNKVDYNSIYQETSTLNYNTQPLKILRYKFIKKALRELKNYPINKTIANPMEDNAINTVSHLL